MFPCWLIMLTVAATAESDIKSDEEVVFFPTAGRFDPQSGEWAFPIHGWIFEPEDDSIGRAVALNVFRRTLGLRARDAANTIFRRRAHAFLVDNERSKGIVIRVGGTTYVVGESNPNGHFEGSVRVAAADATVPSGARTACDEWMSFEAVLPAADDRRITGSVLLLADTGLSVVSDIDDTIKVTHVRDKEALLANTFLRDFEAVPGMAELYQAWAADGAAFHYVSASPWQLYGPLESFMSGEGFPRGTFHLKDFRAKDGSFFNLFAEPDAFKRPILEAMLLAWPRRSYILVGDSGEMDPEIYGALARRFPGQVFRIFIRDVTNETANCARYGRAFEGVPRERWVIFRDAAELTGGHVTTRPGSVDAGDT